MTFAGITRRCTRVVMTTLPVLCLVGTGVLSAGAAQAAPASHSSPGSSLVKLVKSVSTPGHRTPGTHAHTNPAVRTPLLHGRHSSIQGGNTLLEDSTNWDGYTVLPASGSGTTFDEVQAQWVVPAATCDPNQSTQLAVFWVGLDGWGTNSVEQGGTIVACSSGTPTYNVWWEMWPFNDIQDGFSINAGDTIKASVTFVPSTSMFDIVVADVTSGQTLTEDTPCQPGQNGCVRGSAEVISEDPGGGGDVDGLFPLADYSTATYTSASVTDSTGHTGTLSDPAWQTLQINEVSSDGITKQTTGALSPDGSSFTTTWKAELGSPPTGQATALYQTGDTSPTTTEPEPNISLENTGTTAIPLSAITIRYWFTEDGTQPLEYACDYAPIGCSNISATFVQVSPVNGADHYLQLSFGSGAGSLQPNAQTGGIQSRFWQQNFANMTQTNDYSFNANDTSYTANPHITVYYNGTLIYGTEPS